MKKKERVKRRRRLPDQMQVEIRSPIYLTMPVHMLNFLVVMPNSEKLIVLYFYYMSLRGSKRTTNKEAGLDLGWSDRTVYKFRKQLEDMQFVRMESVRSKSGNGKVICSVVHIFHHIVMNTMIIDGSRLPLDSVFNRVYKYTLYKENPVRSFPLVCSSKNNREKGNASKSNASKTSNGRSSLLSKNQQLTKGQEFDQEMTELLMSEVISKRRVKTKGIKYHPFIEQFRLLRQIDMIPITTIEKVIEWYCQHWREPFSPKIYFAKDLRNKFDKMEEAYKRHLAKTKEADTEDDFMTVVKKTRLPNGRTIVQLHYKDGYGD